MREWRKQKEQHESARQEKAARNTRIECLVARYGGRTGSIDIKTEDSVSTSDTNSHPDEGKGVALMSRGVWSYQGVVGEVSTSMWIHSQMQDNSMPVTSRALHKQSCGIHYENSEDDTH